MGLIDGLIAYNDKQNQQSQLADWAQKNTPEIAGLAAQPELYSQLLLQKYDPKLQVAQMQRQAGLQFADSLAPSASPTSPGLVSPDAIFNNPQAIAMGAGTSAPPTSGNRFGLSRDQLRNLAIYSPETLIKIALDNADPAKQASLQKTVAEAQEQQQKAQAPQNARNSIDTLNRDAYTTLNALKDSGGIDSNDASILGHFGNQLRQIPGLGDLVQAVGDKGNKDLRDNLDAIRSQQLSLYRVAANIPAGASNSDIEQKTLKDALVDPNISYEANIKRLNRFQQIYGASSPAQLLNSIPNAASGSASPVNNAIPTVTAVDKNGNRIGLINGKWTKI